jgi:hypothetical protein
MHKKEKHDAKKKHHEKKEHMKAKVVKGHKKAK